jgi:flotillin
MELIIGSVVLLVFLVAKVLFLISRYKRCPSNEVLVIYGKVGEGRTSKVLHGGGAFVWPLIQDYAYMSLTPYSLAPKLTGGISKENIRVNIPTNFTIAISEKPDILKNAAERLLGLDEKSILELANDAIIGQLRQIVSTMGIEELNTDRDKFVESVNKFVENELNKLGLTIINVNIVDIQDESGYLEAIGQRAAQEAKQKAVVDVANQLKLGDTGKAQADMERVSKVAELNKEKEAKVAEMIAQQEVAKQNAEYLKQAEIAKSNAASTKTQVEAQAEIARSNAELEANKIKAQAESDALQVTAKAESAARQVKAQAQSKAEQAKAESMLKIESAKAQADADAKKAEFQSALQVTEARALKEGQVAKLEAEKLVMDAKKSLMVAELEKDQLAQQEVELKKAKLAAEAKAAAIRIEAEAEALKINILAKAKADGEKMMLDAKAAGYENLVKSTGDQLGALLTIEQLPELVKVQAEAIKAIKIDKLSIVEGSNGSAISNLSQDLVKTLPKLHEMAQTFGLQLPPVLGKASNVIEVK